MPCQSRRGFMKLLGATGALSLANSPVMRAFAAPATASDEFFVFIHAVGGWDVTLFADPRWEEKGLVDPASTLNTNTAPITHWRNAAAPLEDGSFSFEPIRQGSLVVGPTIGKMKDHLSRMTLVNGIAMNTVSHFDGTIYAATGRHSTGGRAVASSIDTLFGSEFGVEQTLPVVSLGFPSSYVSGAVDARAVPLSVGSVGTLARSLARSSLYESAAQRDAVGLVLSEEAKDLGNIAFHREAFDSMALQFDSLRALLGRSELRGMFDATGLRTRHPEFGFTNLRFQANGAVNAAFAIEALAQNTARCVSFTFGNFDTHFANYRDQALLQQEAFDTLATLLQKLDTTPHPTRPQAKLADHTHILVFSDFCRTPQINVSTGRDHWPNGSAVIISPRFKGGRSIGSTDAEQLLPQPTRRFSDGMRAVAPEDVLATLLHGLGVSPRKHLRDGEVLSEILVSP